MFKKGTLLRQLQSQWPHGLLHDYVEGVEASDRGDLPAFKDCSDVYHGILLEDGRFAFLMEKEHDDLRCYIDRLMLTTWEDCCPFPKSFAEGLLYRVAEGVD